MNPETYMSSINLKGRRTRGASAASAVLAFMAMAPIGFAQDAADAPALVIGATYTGDLRRNTTGGLETGTAYSQMLKLGADWSNDTLFQEASLSASASVMYMSGDGISADYVGDLQGLNNIESDTGWRLYEVWTEFAFGGSSNTTVRAGVLDLNAEFDAPETLGLFVAPPHGIGTDFSQSGSAGPSIWPVTGLGVRAAGGWENGLDWRLGVYDGAPGGPDGDDFSHIHVSSTRVRSPWASWRTSPTASTRFPSAPGATARNSSASMRPSCRTPRPKAATAASMR